MMKCSVCNNEQSTIKEYEKEFIVKGKKIKSTIKSRFCTKCNSIIYDELLDEEVAHKIIKEYLNKYGIDPNEIKKFRKQYSLSQELFSKIIGCAKKTLISYEKGTSIPNDTYMIILKTILENKESIIPIIEANKYNFDSKEYSFIKNNIYSSINTKKELDITNGYTNFSYDKLKCVISYLANNKIHKTKLLKELFYVDFKCYKEYGYSMTGLSYASIKYGPVPNNYSIILEELIQQKIIELEVKYNDNYEENIIEVKEKNNCNYLDKNEIKILKEIKDYFSNYTVKDIVNFSHNEKAYKQTKVGKLISYDYAFDLQL